MKPTLMCIRKTFKCKKFSKWKGIGRSIKRCYYAYLEEMLPKNVQWHGFTRQKHKG